MAYILREDGERFIVPTYRDIISAKKPSLLKKQILLLSQENGNYVALQRKNPEQYEVAFANEQGYLLGETVWQHFKRSSDFIYCEALPNKTEAILVVVKSGSVYLDGSFPIDSIAEELIVFKTQKTHFDIYIYGDVPISKEPEDEKFSLDAPLTKSFTVLDSPVFSKLPLLKTFQLQPVNTLLETKGIGVLPIKNIVSTFVVIGLFWALWSYMMAPEKKPTPSTSFQQPQTATLASRFLSASNPYQSYIDTLTSPDPADEIQAVLKTIGVLFSIPGWLPDQAEYEEGVLSGTVKSLGARTDLLYAWAKANNVDLAIQAEGFHVNMMVPVSSRPSPTTINPIDDLLSNVLDRVSYLLPRNSVQVGAKTNRVVFTEVPITIAFSNLSLVALGIVGQNLEGLPLVLTNITFTMSGYTVSGSMNFKALGV